ncbi:MAG: hypothetical protein ACR2QW_06800 [bacterium]
MKVLESIQDLLHVVYDLNLTHRVNDFLITDQDYATRLENKKESRPVDEKLLVFENDDELLISLYLAEELLSALHKDNPFEQLHNHNLATFCTALEGVSHFVYLAWNASHDRPVSQLELELQAEVDKFVAIVFVAGGQYGPIQLERLIHWLFQKCRFDSRLKPDELQRYQDANNYASQFCSRLQQSVPGAGASEFDLGELRRFYRKRHLEKLNECESAALIRSP